MFFFPDESRAAEYSMQSCVTTHRAAECLDAPRLLGRTLVRALAGYARHELVTHTTDEIGSPAIARLARGEYLGKHEQAICGSGHVVQSLEAALWCFHRTTSFEAAILTAANLGDDADTTAAICGQIAGAFYGARAIPDAWLDVLHQRDDISALADALCTRPRE
jgi:ADP-ribosyl-[dinitrogen reductase] hydrolase